MTKKEFMEFLNGIETESKATMPLIDMIKNLVRAEFNTHAEEMQIKFNKQVKEMRDDFDKINESNAWRGTDTERHAMLVEEYMANMNEILEKRL